MSRNPSQTRRPLVDPECFALAEYFLPRGTEDQKWELADDIQQAVERWFDVPREERR